MHDPRSAERQEILHLRRIVERRSAGDARGRQALTYGILMAEYGEKHPDAKPLKGFDGASVLEIVADDRGDTFRAVYTVQFEGFIYVLHAFQKKSKKGAKTPKPDMDLIKTRLQAAKKDYEARIKKAS